MTGVYYIDVQYAIFTKLNLQYALSYRQDEKLTQK